MSIYPIVIMFVLLVLASIKQINQYQRGVRFTLGKFSGIMEPGLEDRLANIPKLSKSGC